MGFTLEKIVGKEKLDKIKQNSIYNYAVDTAAMIAFSTPIAMANEVFVAGMTPFESLKARGIATVVNSLTARPYGKYRDYIFEKSGIKENTGFVKKAVTDTLTFATFQAPLYGTILAISGADLKQVIVGTATITALSGFIGRPYGAFLDTFRKFFGKKAAYEISH